MLFLQELLEHLYLRVKRTARTMKNNVTVQLGEEIKGTRKGPGTGMVECGGK